MTNDNIETELSAYFTGDHHCCDEKWVKVEEALDKGDGDTIASTWQDFDQATRRHFEIEEEILFPAFEALSGMGQSGPTVVMRMEHQQMRSLLDQISFAIDSNDTGDALDLGDTLHLLIQQHNIKEEGMLYPMVENVLAGDWPDLRQKLINY
ncbi:MAG: hemerythrin domain-containing protein [Gammaproteobacteria bacterium]|nr:hemerythrin domain-containing protein [Gammaproteobacteria bacterium]